MQPLIGDGTYCVGHSELNAQHQEITENLNQLIDFVESPDCEIHVANQMGDLLKSVHEHLLFEETLLEKMEIPGLKDHKESHFEFLDELAKACQHFEKGQGATAQHLQALLDWFLNHILIDDMKYKAYLEKL
ncbi:hemerythrin family protein [Terasakiella sp. SH-1]|uniref:bacteriohemerythrin n=1 Tax=Terasakiella sp. SH-1 TaxID=2560057 RepID=UPI0010746945|nr:hemerythrin family protein [Terasakiella sp. SH-1]